MNFTKSTLLAMVCGAGLLASATAFASPADPATFQAEKDIRIANIQERLQIVQTHLSCVQAAQDHPAMKACHDTAEQAQKALVEKLKAQMADRKALRAAQKQAAPAAPTAPTTTP
jgi:hypothetical protein